VTYIDLARGRSAKGEGAQLLTGNQMRWSSVVRGVPFPSGDRNGEGLYSSEENFKSYP